MFAVGILKLAGDIGFEPMMTISKTVALGQARRIPNRLLIADAILKHTISFPLLELPMHNPVIKCVLE